MCKITGKITQCRGIDKCYMQIFLFFNKNILQHLKLRHVHSMSCTFSVITKNTLSSRPSNCPAKCTYATSILIHFFIYMALLTYFQALILCFVISKLAITAPILQREKKKKIEDSLNRGLVK